MRSRLPLLLVLLVLFPVARCVCGSGQDERPPCETEADCTGEQTCIDAPSGRVCAVLCGADTPCSSGQACVRENGVLSCRELIESRALGELCVSDRECISGACVGPDELGDFFCAGLCEADDDCPDEEFCFLADYRRVCLEPLTPQLAAGESCERGPRECESRACVKINESDATGSCVDQCEPDVGCTGERNCVELPDGADVCIAYFPDGTACENELVCENQRCVRDDDESQLCTRTCVRDDDCASGWVCVPTVEDNDACMPLRDDAGEAGEACDSKRDCLSGHCAGFDDGVTDHGQLCADPCAADDTCADAELVCWELDPPNPNLCGPFPTQP